MSANSLIASSSLVPSAADLEGFRAAQRLAYACAEAIHAELRPGITEREVAAKMKAWLAAHGATDCLHQPFAWFGHRTAFRGLIGVNQLKGFNPAFFPSNKKLEENMPFILDCAPTLNGYTADIGYAGVLGRNGILDQLMDDLAPHRELIIRMIRERRLMSEVSQAVDALCIKQGVEPRHHAYPFSVLAHRVEKLPATPIAPKISLGRFGIRSVLSLGREALQGVKEGWSPLWASHQRSAHAPVPGLWAVEPHLGFREVGAKFEELLVITEDDAFWLDDDVPHVRRWMERGVIGKVAPKVVNEKSANIPPFDTSATRVVRTNGEKKDQPLVVSLSNHKEAAPVISKHEVVSADAKLAVRKVVATKKSIPKKSAPKKAEPEKVAAPKAKAEKPKTEKPKATAKPTEKAEAKAAEKPASTAAEKTTHKSSSKKSTTRKTETA
ncbi:MAG: M24 family metallopeptidase [Moraxellaceae bacterium]